MKLQTFYFFTSLIVLSISCQKTKETINKGGETVGETATEFIEGISEGVDRTLENKIVLSKELTDKGVKTGKFYIENDSIGKDNKVVIYMITEKRFNDTVTFKIKDKKGIELGRQKLIINSEAGDAGYYDIVFDPRTNIEVKSTIEIN